MKIDKMPFDDRYVIYLYEKDDLDSYIAHHGHSLTLFLTPEQLKELQSLKVEEPSEGGKVK